MASVNISIKDEAYEFLKSLKTDDKSFSDVILSFKNDKNDLWQLFGSMQTKKSAMSDELRKNFRKGFQRLS